MPLSVNDIKLRLSVPTATTGNSSLQGDPNASLGAFMSVSDISDSPLNNVFDNISGAENAAGATDYRCIFIYNANDFLTYQSVKIWLSGSRCTSTGSTDTVNSVAHPFSNNDAVRVEAELTTDTLPTGLTNSTTYYVTSRTTDSFKLATTQSGSPIDIGDSTGFSVRPFGATSLSIGVDTAGVVDADSSTAQALSIANENVAPAGITFSSPTTKAAAISLGDILPGKCIAVWLKRVALNAGARNVDGFYLQVSGDSQ